MVWGRSICKNQQFHDFQGVENLRLATPRQAVIGCRKSFSVSFLRLLRLINTDNLNSAAHNNDASFLKLIGDNRLKLLKICRVYARNRGSGEKKLLPLKRELESLLTFEENLPPPDIERFT